MTSYSILSLDNVATVADTAIIATNPIAPFTGLMRIQFLTATNSDVTIKLNATAISITLIADKSSLGKTITFPVFGGDSFNVYCSNTNNITIRVTMTKN